MGCRTDEVRVAAGWACAALASSGYRVDFTLDSLGEVDRFLANQMQRGRLRRGSVLGRDPDGRMFAVGAYVGEVIRRTVGGTWVADAGEGDDSDGGVCLVLDDGHRLRPQRHVRQLVEDGGRPGVAAYGAHHTAGRRRSDVRASGSF